MVAIYIWQDNNTLHLKSLKPFENLAISDAVKCNCMHHYYQYIAENELIEINPKRFNLEERKVYELRFFVKYIRTSPLKRFVFAEY
jgi:hypothetical protein